MSPDMGLSPSELAAKQGEKAEIAAVPVSTEAGVCSYCGLRFGTLVKWHGRLRYLAETRDHLRPRAAGGLGGKNLIPCCSICNTVKGSRIFATYMEAKLYILDELLRGGFARIGEQPLAVKASKTIDDTLPAAAVTLRRACLDCGRGFLVNLRHAEAHQFCTTRCRVRWNRAKVATAEPSSKKVRVPRPGPPLPPLVLTCGRRKRYPDGNVEFMEWVQTEHGKNVCAEVLNLCWSLLDAGWKRYSMDAIINHIRWNRDIELGPSSSDEYKINDHVSSRLARFLMHHEPELAGFFEVRRLRG